jgi:hypothetical protein
MVDAHNEQLDLRTETSWVNNIEQVSLVEALEVQTINSTVPFMLVSFSFYIFFQMLYSLFDTNRFHS